MRVRLANKPEKHNPHWRWVVSTKKEQIAEFYLGWLPRLGFELNLGARVFALHLVFFALYLHLWGADYGDDDRLVFGAAITPEALLYLHWFNHVKFIYYPWATTWLYSRSLRPAAQVTKDTTRGKLRRVGRDLWNIDHERDFLIRIIRMVYRWFVRKGRTPAWMLSTNFSGIGNRAPGKPYFWDLPKWTTQFDYQYVRRNGEIQKRTAKVTVEERGWNPWILSFLPFALVRHTSLDISFSEEVGERTGSWKGGVLGTGIDMKFGETIEQCFRRFERDRKFN